MSAGAHLGVGEGLNPRYVAGVAVDLLQPAVARADVAVLPQVGDRRLRDQNAPLVLHEIRVAVALAQVVEQGGEGGVHRVDALGAEDVVEDHEAVDLELRAGRVGWGAPLSPRGEGGSKIYANLSHRYRQSH